MRASLNGHGKVSWLAGPYCDGPPHICLRGVGWLGMRGMVAGGGVACAGAGMADARPRCCACRYAIRGPWLC